MDAALRALADRTRREILALVWHEERTAGEIASEFSMTHPAVSQHLKVLLGSNLVSLRRAGTRRFYRVNQPAIARLQAELASFWDDGLSRLKQAAERTVTETEAPMNGTLNIEREIFIAASPETVFRFFVEPALMARWFGQQHTLDPRPGGIFRVEVTAGKIARGTYTEITPHRRIAFTWGWEGRDDLPPGRSLVEIEFVAQNRGTLLRLRHSGLPTMAEAPFTPEEHRDRWANYLVRLEKAVRNPGES